MTVIGDSFRNTRPAEGSQGALLADERCPAGRAHILLAFPCAQRRAEREQRSVNHRHRVRNAETAPYARCVAPGTPHSALYLLTHVGLPGPTRRILRSTESRVKAFPRGSAGACVRFRDHPGTLAQATFCPSVQGVSMRKGGDPVSRACPPQQLGVGSERGSLENRGGRSMSTTVETATATRPLRGGVFGRADRRPAPRRRRLALAERGALAPGRFRRRSQPGGLLSGASGRVQVAWLKGDR